MAIDALSNDILVDELQLGEQLNESVHSARRADFSLLLAMLTDDVRAHSQFKLPQTQAAEKNTTSEQLRKSFQLPEVAPLALQTLEDIKAFNQAELVEQQQMQALRLVNTLQPKALAFRDDARHIEQDILTNTSLYCQQKVQQESSTPTEQRAEFNVNAWLAAVNTTRVKAPILDACA
ncbi:MAG: VC2046/SO_2500 family protein [Cognaticolwellia sp.]